MRRIFLLFFITSLTFSFAGPAFADDPAKRLTGGINDVVAAPFEIFKGIEDAAIEQGIFGGATVGTLQGISNALTRALKGAFEIVTFPLSFPASTDPLSQDEK